MLRSRLLKWYREEQRDLPWRHTNDPYRIWVSEIMLQQTQVKTVVPYYERWVESFPTVEDLARAREVKVLKHWEGLGYYSRARNLHRAANIVTQEFGGQVPDTVEPLSQLPGIGRYTAGAVLSIAFGKRAPVLDGNVKRVLSRWFCISENGATATSQQRLWKIAESVLPNRNVGAFNQALMELGATVCLPKNPVCLFCPVKSDCEANRQNRQGEFPQAKAKRVSKKIEVSAAVIWRRDRVFIQQRPQKGLMGGLWEFPGGKREKNETPEACLAREIREELGVVIEVGEKLMIVKHTYTQFRVTLHVFECKLTGGRIRARCCEQWKWVTPSSLKSFPFPAANVKIVEQITKNGKR